ncbi:MAG: hypothetical protein FJ255_10650 [Phycisphaerae bacterium]|nr:hypothetical protein [Phycisphaerae bacterium]
MAVLGLAGAALLVDRVILGGASSPSSASASQEASGEVPSASAAPAAPPHEAPASKTLAAQRLAALDAGVEIDGADGFAAPAAWAPARAASATPAAPSVDPSENALLSSLRLTSVITSGRPAARINDRLVLVGMRMPDGVELVGVSERSATVRLPSGAEHTIELKRPG